MNVENFFEIFIQELEEHQELRGYYKFPKKISWFEFRKAYFCQRLEFIQEQVQDVIKSSNNDDIKVWDCGCGFGTTSLFLAINNIRVHGTTIGDHYEREIPRRKEFWSKYGNVKLFTTSYEALPYCIPEPSSYNAVIIQDSLHHMEPLGEILEAFHTALRPKGRLIITEPNGNNLFHRVKLFLRRGNKRINEIYDERLKRAILYADENFRSLDQWKKELRCQDFYMESNIQYIKLFFPYFYNGKNTKHIINLEQKILNKIDLLKDYLYFGINFTAFKADD